MKRNPFIVIILLSLLVLPFSAFAQQEGITIATYYPSPSGVYAQLVTQTLGVGDNDLDGALTFADVPDLAAHPGEAWIKGKVGIGTTASPNAGSADLEINGTLILTPTATADSTVEGALYYNATGVLKYYHNGGWRNMGTALSLSNSTQLVTGLFIKDNPAGRTYNGCNDRTVYDNYLENLAGKNYKNAQPATYEGASMTCPANSVITGLNVRTQDMPQGCDDRPEIQYVNLNCTAFNN